jgi:hypothetical protein
MVGSVVWYSSDRYLVFLRPIPGLKSHDHPVLRPPMGQVRPRRVGHEAAGGAAISGPVGHTGDGPLTCSQGTADFDIGEARARPLD